MIKRKISMIMTIVMLMTSVPSFAFGSERDYSNHWAAETIQKWYDNSMIKGYDDGSFKPENSISRAEFMTMINSSYGFTEKASISFDDVAGNVWYYNEVQKAVQAGYIIGNGNNTIRPMDDISREEVAVIISRLNGLNENKGNTEMFVDKNKISDWALGFVGAAAKAGYMIGNDKGEFCPLNIITRAESLVTIDRAIEDVPTNDLPDEDVPINDLPDEDVPANDLPDEDVPTNDFPDEDMSDNDTSSNYAKLDNILIEGASLEQAFNAEKTAYSAIASSSESVTIKAITSRESTITAYINGVECAQINFESYNGGAAYVINVPINSSGTTTVTLTYSEPDLEDGLYTITINK